MKAALRVLNELVEEGSLGQYAIGGAMGALFYAEPVMTFDLDIFVVLPKSESGLITLEPLYEALRRRGYAPGEYVMIEDVPVQFLPAYNALLEEALAKARPDEVEGVPTRILMVEHLIAIAVQTGRPKDRERVRILLKEGNPDRSALEDICKRHNLKPPTLDNGEAPWTPLKL